MLKRQPHSPRNGITPDAIARLKAQDAATWECVVHYCSPRLTADARTSLQKRLRENDLHLNDDEESRVLDEIVQDTWVKFLNLLGDFVYQDEEKLFRYLHNIAINRIRRWVKAHIRDNRHLAIDEESDSPSDDWLMYLGGYTAPSPEAQIIIIHILEGLPKVFDELKLNRTHGDIFMRHYMNEEPVEALAAEYGMKAKSLRQVLRRIAERIKPYLA